MNSVRLPNDDAAPITEISILPDGRVHIHGTTLEVLDVLKSLKPREEAFGELLRRVEGVNHGQ